MDPDKRSNIDIKTTNMNVNAPEIKLNYFNFETELNKLKEKYKDVQFLQDFPKDRDEQLIVILDLLARLTLNSDIYGDLINTLNNANETLENNLNWITSKLKILEDKLDYIAEENNYAVHYDITTGRLYKTTLR